MKIERSYPALSFIPGLYKFLSVITIIIGVLIGGVIGGVTLLAASKH